MTLVPLSTYLKMYRKRTGLSHEDLAFLLGGMSGSSVSRHERSERIPLLRTVLMYEFILDTPACDLYKGVSFEARMAVRKRAVGLLASLEKQKRNATRDRKILVVRKLLDEEVTPDAA